MGVVVSSEVNGHWLIDVFLQNTTTGRRGQTGIRWRGAAFQLWAKPRGIFWAEPPRSSRSTAGWTGPRNMVEPGSSERKALRLLLVRHVAIVTYLWLKEDKSAACLQKRTTSWARRPTYVTKTFKLSFTFKWGKLPWCWTSSVTVCDTKPRFPWGGGVSQLYCSEDVM